MIVDYKIILFLAAVLCAALARAEVELPQNELSKESVVPRFENSTTVKSRNVVTENKFEAGVYYGWNFSEPIENQNKLGLNVGYHWNEENALFINYASWMSGLNSQYTGSLAKSYLLDFNRAPQLQSSVWLNYQILAFYGKISLTKNGVMNVNVYPITGVGMTNYSNKSYYGVNVGAGCKFHFTPGIALRTDFKFQYSGQPSPFLSSFMRTNQPTPQASQFGDVTVLGTVLDVGLIGLF